MPTFQHVLYTYKGKEKKNNANSQVVCSTVVMYDKATICLAKTPVL